MATYTVEIYQFSPVTGLFTRIDEIATFQNLSFFNKLSGVGGLQLTLNIFDQKATRTNLTRYRNQICVKRDDIVVYFGPITNVSSSYNNVDGYLLIDSQTYLAHLKSRYTDKIIQYVSTDQSTIAWGIINTTQGKTNGDLGIDSGTLASASVSRDRTYEYKNVAEALIDLSKIIGGIDFDFTVTTDAYNKVSGVLFNTYYPVKGSNRTELNKLKIGENIHSVNFKTTDSIYNYGISEGAGTGENVLLATSEDTASEQSYTRREVTRMEKDVSLSDTLTRNLDAFINSKKTEHFDIDLVLNPNSHPYFDELTLGDILYLDLDVKNNLGVSGGYVSFTGQARLIELAVDIDAQMNELVSPKVQLYD